MTVSINDVCAHNGAYIQTACCSPYQRIIECGCGGQDAIICPNKNCPGINDDELIDLREQLRDKDIPWYRYESMTAMPDYGTTTKYL